MPGYPPAPGRAGKGPGSLCGPLPLTAAAGKAAGPAPAAPSGVLFPAGSEDSPAWVPCAAAAGKDKVCLLLRCPPSVCASGHLQPSTHCPQNSSGDPGESLQEPLWSHSQQIKSRYPCPVLLQSVPDPGNRLWNAWGTGSLWTWAGSAMQSCQPWDTHHGQPCHGVLQLLI